MERRELMWVKKREEKMDKRKEDEGREERKIKMERKGKGRENG